MSGFRLLIFTAVTGACLMAQTPTASVLGRVVDGSGAVVPGVSIKVTNQDTNQPRSSVTNGAGDYTIPYLNPGRYTMEADANGFATYKHSGFTLVVDQEQRIDIKLEVGATTQTVTVVETPEALNTESGARGDVTSNAELTEMPLNGRNYSDLAYLTGGVVPKGADGDGQFAVNGARADNVSFMVDGMNNTQRRNTTVMVSPPLEGIQEFKLITSGFSAEYGRFAGGVLSMVTKAGGNRLRGSLYEFLRNDALDARNFFDGTKSKLIQNQFGATLSGPVVLPKIYNGHDKTFFLVSWESQRRIGGSTTRGIVPQQQMLQGDFSQALDAYGKPETIIDPLAKNAPFPGNKIPAARLDPVALAIASYYPKPNLLGSVNNYLAQANSTSDFDKYSFKVDHTLGPNDRLTFSTMWNNSQSLSPFQRSPVAIFGATNNTFGLLSGIRYIHTFSPSLFNEASANFSRNTLNQPNIGSDHDWSAQAGFNGATKDPTDLGLPYVSVSGYIDLGQAYDLPKVWAYNNFQYADAVTWIKGRHTVKFGADFLHYQYFNHDYADLRGRMTFLGRFTNDPMADFVMGYAQTSRRLTAVGSSYLLVSNYSGFAQDDLKVTPSLTLNVGLRYELMKQPAEKNDGRSMFIPELGKLVMAGTGGLSQSDFNALIASTGITTSIAMASDVGLPRTLVNTNYKNFAPRFGYAWRPFGNSHTVIRGGYGIFYGLDSLYRYDPLSDTFPFVNTLTFSATSTNPLALTVSNPFPASKAKNSGVTSTVGMSMNNPTQYLQTFSTTIEHDLGAGTVLEMAYSGSKGTHLPRYYNLNQQYIFTGKGVGPRPFPVFSTINIFADVANSIYNSGTLTLRRRLSKQFFVRATYVYSKSIDASSNTGGVIAAGFPNAQNAYDLAAERGRSDFDVGHSFMASFIWAPNLWHNRFLRDWQVSGTTTAYTGPPFTPKVANYDITTGGAARPNRTGSGKLDSPTPDQWFNRTAFPVVPVGAFQFGTSGRNILDGPGTFALNVGLSRRFRFTETKALQFRCESFNLTNHTSFGLPVTNVDVLNGGTISTAKSPRQLQMGLRLEF
jgi:hypothetical protein